MLACYITSKFTSMELRNLPKMDPKMAPKSSQNGPQDGPKMPPSKRPLLTRPKHCKTAVGSPKMCNPPRLGPGCNQTVFSRLARLIMYLRGYYYGRWRFPSSAEARASTESDGVITPRATDNVS